jgi:AraC family transcriptional regulator of adaptative response/methylated-DNA-[protein]-cysteine methyltransferase
MMNLEQCWAALASRDAGADGAFVYAVRTTGVYCRPGCASRLPRRENVAFYETPAAAEAAGFRPCKRCRPNEGSIGERHVAAIGRACALIRAQEALPSLAELADAACLSRFHFHRVFKQITGTTPREWGKAHRLDRFAEQLDSGESVAAAVYGAGFGASSRAYEAAPNGLGMTPGARRHGGRGETIRFTTVETGLGWALVASTERGICMTALGDERAALEAELRRRFPAALIWPADAALTAWAERIVSSSRGPTRSPICRSISAAPRSRRWCGAPCRGSRRGGPRAMARSPPRSAGRARCAPWRKPAPPTSSQSWCRVTGWCAAMARLPGIAGGSSASAP